MTHYARGVSLWYRIGNVWYRHFRPNSLPRTSSDELFDRLVLYGPSRPVSAIDPVESKLAISSSTIFG